MASTGMFAPVKPLALALSVVICAVLLVITSIQPHTQREIPYQLIKISDTQTIVVKDLNLDHPVVKESVSTPEGIAIGILVPLLVVVPVGLLTCKYRCLLC